MIPLNPRRRSETLNMKVSVVLLDWSVRESFHSIVYLNDQSVDRENYELVWVEYFDRKVPVLEEHYHAGRLDKYLVLGNRPGDYNKHEAWNTGVIYSSGDIIVLCDSDAIFRHSFIQKIIEFFESHENSFLYIDEIRSENKGFWPFSYPTWEEVMAEPDLVNWNQKHRVTTGLAPEHRQLSLYNKMFIRNYGACLCVKKSDYIRYGGLDEHDSYVGYICGPYDLAIRMINGGIRENWHNDEFLLHTYHPREKPSVDRIGPHFRNNSTTSLKHLFDGFIMPYDENHKIRHLRRKMFPEPDRKGKPKFSVIVPKACPSLIQRLYDSVRNSTKLPYEVIFIGEEDYMIDGDLKYIKFGGSLTESIVEGCSGAVGEIMVIVPPHAVFRPNALDRLLDFQQKKLEYPAICLKAIETFTAGFIWQHCLNHCTCSAEIWPMVAFGKNILSDKPAGKVLEKIISGEKTGVVHQDLIHLEIWHNNAYLYDDYLQSLLDKMLKLKHEFWQERMEMEIVREVHKLFDQICATERNSPGSFLKYCFFQRYHLREIYDFIGIFSRLNRIEENVKGLHMLIDGVSAFVKNIDTNVKEAAWLKESIHNGVISCIGAAHFNLAIWELNRNQKAKADLHLKSCLECNPGFAAAVKNLKSLYVI